MLSLTAIFITAVCAAVVRQKVLDIDTALNSYQFIENLAPDNSSIGAEAFRNPNTGAPFYDAKTQSWTGYLNIPNGRQMFFWYVRVTKRPRSR